MIKNTKKQLELIDENIADLKSFSDKLSLLETTDKDKFWSTLKSAIEKSIEGAKDVLVKKLSTNDDNHPGNTLANAKFVAGQIDGFRGILEMVDSRKENLDEVATRIKELQNRKEEIKSNIDLQQ